MHSLRYLLLFASILVFSIACDRDDTNIKVKISDLEIKLDPNGYSPLTALLRFNTNAATAVQVRVVGKHGAASDLVRQFPEAKESFEVPVIGLYAEHENEVELTFLNAEGEEVGTESLTIQTDPLIADMPEIEVNVESNGNGAAGWSLVNYFGFATERLPQRPLMFDEFGDIRWYLNFRGHPVLKNLFCDYGMQQLRNGNLVFGNNNNSRLYEINFLGEVVNSWDLQGYGFHHTVIEKPNGNFLVTVNDYSKETREDVILEIDRNTGEIANTWDLTVVLDEKRRTLPTGRADLDIDWFHANGLAYSESDDCIVISGRTQGVVKLTADNELVWILGPHRGWETAGNGTNLQDFLLQPLDASGNLITDTQVLEGEINHPDFEWNWYQHSPILKPNGNLMVFDNGEFRNYGNSNYSRAVEFKIDEENKTVQQVWQYGKAREHELFSPITSNVMYDEASDRVIFSPGSTNYDSEYGKTIEIDRGSGAVVFEATVIAPRTTYGITFHNVQRVQVD